MLKGSNHHARHLLQEVPDAGPQCSLQHCGDLSLAVLRSLGPSRPAICQSSISSAQCLWEHLSARTQRSMCITADRSSCGRILLACQVLPLTCSGTVMASQVCQRALSCCLHQRGNLSSWIWYGTGWEAHCRGGSSIPDWHFTLATWPAWPATSTISRGWSHCQPNFRPCHA